jgi:hypothetical protein
MKPFSCPRRSCTAACGAVTRGQRACAHSQQGAQHHVVERREALLAACGVALGAAVPPAGADVEYATLLGKATPPASYGGFGGNSKEAPKYKFDYPASWKEKTVNKQQKVCIWPMYPCQVIRQGSHSAIPHVPVTSRQTRVGVSPSHVVTLRRAQGGYVHVCLPSHTGLRYLYGGV